MHCRMHAFLTMIFPAYHPLKFLNEHAHILEGESKLSRLEFIRLQPSKMASPSWESVWMSHPSVAKHHSAAGCTHGLHTQLQYRVTAVWVASKSMSPKWRSDTDRTGSLGVCGRPMVKDMSELSELGAQFSLTQWVADGLSDACSDLIH